MATIELRGVDHVGIRYRDLPAAEKFWVEQVGLKVVGRIRAGVFLEVAPDGAHLACFQAEGDEKPLAAHHVALRLSRGSLEGTIHALEARGVKVEPVGPNQGFHDPEGNAFHFVEV
jgi:catechol 2,3-dioxygenase-like lactoylglutathione lyase family enzyme